MERKKTVKVQLILVTFKRLLLNEIDIYNASALTKSISIKCGIHHTPEENQVKTMCNVPHLANLFPSRPEYIKKSYLLLVSKIPYNLKWTQWRLSGTSPKNFRKAANCSRSNYTREEILANILELIVTIAAEKMYNSL